MVAHSKHRKSSPRKDNNHNNHHPRKTHAGRLNAPAQLPLARPPVKEEEFPKETDEEPRPEDLAKEEEALKAAELEEAAAAAESDAESHAEQRGRERSSYDGDTAIKLYLREIGQVKLPTPQEEIELSARIKNGDKKPPSQIVKSN